MKPGKSLATILVCSYLTSGCNFNFVATDQPPEEELIYSTTEEELADCVSQSPLKGFLGNDGRTQRQIEIWGPEAWEILKDSYTECFEEESNLITPNCQYLLGIPKNEGNFLFPLHQIITVNGLNFYSGILDLEQYAVFTKDFGCEYEMQELDDQSN